MCQEKTVERQKKQNWQPKLIKGMILFFILSIISYFNRNFRLIKGGKNMNMIYTVAIKEKPPNSRIKSRTKTQK